jgi:hypothetical protein
MWTTHTLWCDYCDQEIDDGLALEITSSPNGWAKGPYHAECAQHFCDELNETESTDEAPTA